MKKLLLGLLMISMGFLLISCEEAEEGVDDEIDIIIRNATDNDVWVTIDGEYRGEVENNGIARTVWDDADPGDHTIKAYINDNYTDLYCEVTTGFLDGDEDFQWYLESDGDYSGDKQGECY